MATTPTPAPDGRPTPAISDAPPPKAKGKAPRLSDADLDALATVTDADVADAAAWWEEVAPAEWRGLIDAMPDDSARRS